MDQAKPDSSVGKDACHQAPKPYIFFQTHRVERENWLSQVVLGHLYVHYGTYVHLK